MPNALGIYASSYNSVDAPVTTYSDIVLADSPVGYWKLDETSGTTAVDSSGNGFNGAYIGGPALVGDNLGTKLGNVAYFDGVDDVVDLPSLGSSAWATYSVEAWVSASTVASSMMAIGEAYGSGSTEIMLSVGIGLSGSGTALSAGRFSGSWAVASSADAQTDTIYHLVSTHDGVTIRLYVNGLLAASTAASGITGDLWQIGRGDAIGEGASPYWHGAIGHVAVYDSVLSLSQISSHYRAGVSGYVAEVLADSPLTYWKLTDTSGSTAMDISGNNKNATYNGSPTLATRNLNSILGDVADFDGTNDYVSLAAGNIGTGLSALTVELWCKFDVINNRSGLISEVYSGGGDAFPIELALSPDAGRAQKLSIARYNGGSYAIQDANWIPSTDTLYHFVGIHDGSALRLYVNGDPVCSVNASFVNDDNGWVAGICHGLDNPHDGAIGHVAIYDHALSRQRIKDHYLAGIGSAADSTTRYLDTFNRASLGTVAANGATYTGDGAWSIVSNYLSSPSASFQSIVADFGKPDVDISVDVRNNPGGDNCGITLRYTDSNNWVRAVVDDGNVYLGVRTAGTYTNWASSTASTVGRTLRVVAVGTSYTVYVGGVQKISYTDTTSKHLFATKHGAHANNVGAVLDNLEVIPLVRELNFSTEPSSWAVQSPAIYGSSLAEWTGTTMHSIQYRDADGQRIIIPLSAPASANRFSVDMDIACTREQFSAGMLFIGLIDMPPGATWPGGTQQGFSVANSSKGFGLGIMGDTDNFGARALVPVGLSWVTAAGAMGASWATAGGNNATTGYYSYAATGNTSGLYTVKATVELNSGTGKIDLTAATSTGASDMTGTRSTAAAVEWSASPPTFSYLVIGTPLQSNGGGNTSPVTTAYVEAYVREVVVG